MSTRWIPKGFHTITPNIVADDAEQAVAFFSTLIRVIVSRVQVLELP